MQEGYRRGLCRLGSLRGMVVLLLLLLSLGSMYTFKLQHQMEATATNVANKEKREAVLTEAVGTHRAARAEETKAALVAKEAVVPAGNQRVSKISISVCIPAIARDDESGCLLRLVQSTRQQTVWPSEIVLSLTGCTLEVAEMARKMLQAAANPIPLRIVRSSETYIQGKSRNNAVLASHSDLVTFIDADDEMHPCRLEIIERLFLENQDLTMLLHGFTWSRFMKRQQEKEEWTKLRMSTL